MREELSLAPFCRKSPRAPVTGMTWLPLSAGAADQDLNPGAGFRGQARLHSCSDNSSAWIPTMFQQGPCGTLNLSGVGPVGTQGWREGMYLGGGRAQLAHPLPLPPQHPGPQRSLHWPTKTPASRVCPPQKSLKDRSRTTGVSKHFLRLLRPAPGFCGL